MAARMGWSLTLVGLVLVGATLGLIVMGRPVRAYPAWLVLTGLAVPLLLLGGLIWSRRPEERFGRIVLAVGLVVGVTLFAGEYATYAYLRSPRLPSWGGAAWISSVAQVGTIAGLLLLMLVFPTGSLLSRRWRLLGWALWIGATAGVLDISISSPTFNSNIDFIPNPLGILHPPAIVVVVDGIGQIFFAAAVVGTIVQLVVRFLRSEGERREQMKWFAFAGVLGPTTIAIPTLAFPRATEGLLGSVVWTLAPLLVIGAMAVAVLRYRLYDIDVVINKSLVYGSLAGFITAVYVGVVVGIGSFIGQGTSQPNLGLSILATAVVAIAFQPVRERVQRLANLLVYGKRATPYEVLSEFSYRMAGTVASDDVLPRMAKILGEGTGAREARVWLGPSGRLTPAAGWPDRNPNGSSPEKADLLVPVIHQGEELGALSIAKAPGERLTPSEEHLVNDLASQAGLVLRNVRLIEDLKASRVRLVQAQDAERRRIERNIHDGAQQQLVALQVKLGLARRMGTDPQKLEMILTQLQTETNQALQDLRDLARGIYPPLLADQGLVAALEAQARRAPLPVTLEAHEISRYSSETEAAVYFCVLEALQNVAKYAQATGATVRLAAADGHLRFTVTDDGVGFDTQETSYGTGLQGMADRLAALGGEVEVRSKPGGGTTVTGRLPVDTLA